MCVVLVGDENRIKRKRDAGIQKSQERRGREREIIKPMKSGRGSHLGNEARSVA